MKITVKVREVYGNKTIYPVCDKAKLFAKMLGQKTLTHSNLCLIEQIGFLIEAEQQTLAA
ncbi:hypothetical protein [Limnoglobus roseus]|uniref:Uncharacterized protein n=1 Tax=Limnoglobus roseus TaxID=2598579 RepID=A0A5C1APD2_9BACT|nr:hypothetical protein [Limnoglobus roseus]QEL18728.1 hypothetical protein PX52LOC_05764 [Limnoglobus roseus]